VGSNKEAAFVDEVYTELQSRTSIMNVAGHTGIPELIGFMRTAKAVLSTDSGPAHLANALGTPLLVLFGAGNEKNTGPYRNENAKVIRLNQLACEPCTSNQCKPYKVPRCLMELDELIIVTELINLIKTGR
jgi:ADP-heptose:LPS heptosyltransferase